MSRNSRSVGPSVTHTATVGLTYWARNLTTMPRSRSSLAVEETLFNHTADRLDRLEVSLKKGKALPTFEADQIEFGILSRLKPHVEQGLPIRDFELMAEEERRLRGFQFISAKPILVMFNLGDETETPQIDYVHQKSAITSVRGRLEMDIAQLEAEEDRAMFMEEYSLTELSAARIIRESYDLLGRMVFFTIGEDGRFTFSDKVSRRYASVGQWPDNQTENQNLATSVQHALEHAVLHLVEHTRELASSSHLCYAGGVALNAVANEEIIRHGTVGSSVQTDAVSIHTLLGN